MRIIPRPELAWQEHSSAEYRVAKLLEQVDLPAPVTALYSVLLPEHEYKAMSEIDFLVVSDDVVLVIEIKGGRLSRNGGEWTYTDRYGVGHHGGSGPFEQARSAMWSFKGRIEPALGRLSVAFGYLVITPDVDLGSSTEWAVEEYAGHAQMTVAGMAGKLKAAHTFALDRWRSRPTGHAHDVVVKAVRPDFDRVLSLGTLASGLEPAFVRLGEEQYRVIEGIETNPRLFCTGGAGTGKSLLAAATADRAAAAGKRVLLTAESRRVCDYLRSITRSDGVDVVAAAEIGGGRRWDLLVVDEAQDLMNPDDWFRLDDSLTDGLQRGEWRIFCDPNNQSHVTGRFDQSTYDELRAAAIPVNLTRNCRNTANIVAETQRLLSADLGTPLAGEGPKVGYLAPPASDRRTQADAIDTELKRLFDDGVAAANIVVVTLCSRAGESVAVETHAAARRRLIHQTGPIAGAGRVVRLVTATDIKGLEAAHVLVVDLDAVEDPGALPRLYVAMTRARVSLWLCSTPVFARFVKERTTQWALSRS